ncbi:hypothetical protein MAA_11107 [Metarhizium robertsii ARSEF 23]|uniref:Uncharacterized protein n=1 Tax=Metarhizium robertsii (strain ARSEF 23 / ATCC MYA-3075) TaxID=655844 RepID=A0A0B2XIE5_METRA|nr:uncharacterized protein MAA_11107 [Metarhizium robertsii ARSEF 23]KHO11292.1 hypothetical protein MAA_11107 [Metarhizium robertsii ARSEF 23]
MEWVNFEIACFSIVTSLWFCRARTSLELAKSHKVKTTFKSRNGGHVIKNLDVDILGHLFHKSAAMASQSFNCCPTNMLDMPPAENGQELVVRLCDKGLG